MKIRLVLAGLAVFGIAVGLIFYRLGGMQKPTISKVFAPQYTVVGQEYNGKLNQKFNKFQAQLHQDRSQFTGDFILIYDQNTNQPDVEVSVFGGFIVSDTTNIPENYKVKQVTEREVIRVSVISHPLVAPSAIQVEESIKEFAQERGLQIGKGFIEKYTQNQNEIITEVPIKN